ncbi:DUF2339 domain-containing protein [Legionella bononiensis]|uniref:DUF2339 domain-containing protein n=1 Tax=Legionella bononiensis TaxID=2793102 RepID=A0ABS1WB98_9GAMM|nr:DUF2339 domain-containing protein [Legionella bononiensis]MBL7480923.1 DUF2339 domain-containing protein [Legionella bononiensis]MBL7526631.1 DUF2339 domain-containing protein [Legionella bononiensis]MBL7564038.1 DUF2339 domain-containing protein [Legionella bononiensis]
MYSPLIEKKLEDIQSRIETLETKLKINKQPAEEPGQEEIKEIPKPISGNLLGVVSSICFILAAGFIFKLSIDSGWLTHEKQLGLASLLGLALFAAGILISNTDKLYASFLPAAGSTILYLTCFAAFQFYYLISFQTVIAITCIITGISLWFYIQFKHDIYAVIAAIGAYSAPFVTNIDNNAFFSLYYFIICSLTFATLSIWVQSRTLTVISSYLAISITAFIGLNLHLNAIIASALALNFLIFSMATYFYTRLTHNALTVKESWSLFPVLLVFYAMEYYYISRIDPALASLVSIAAAALLVALNLSAKRRSPNRTMSSSGLVLTFVTLVFFHSIYLELLPADIKPWLFVIIVIGYSLLHKQICLKDINNIKIIPIIALSSILGIEYLNMLSHLAMQFNASWAIVSWTSFLSLWYIIIKHHSALNTNKNYIYPILAAAHILCIMGLYQITINYGSLAVSTSWLIYALIVLSFSYIKKDLIMAKSVLIVLSFAAGKALLYDAASTPNIHRTLSLILTGIVLYTSGLVIRKMAR